MLAVEAALDALADDEHRRRRAVVGAEAAVLFDAAAELGEDHHRHVVGRGRSASMSSMKPRTASAVYISSRLCRSACCTCVSNELPCIGDVVEPRRHAGRDERRDALQVAAESAADAVVHRRAIGRRGLAHEVRALGRVLRRRRRGTRASRCVVVRGWLSSASACFSSSVPSRRKRAGSSNTSGECLPAPHRERLRVAEVDDHVARRGVVGLRRRAGRASRAARRRWARRCARTPSTRNATGSDGRSRSRGRPPAGRPCRAARSRPSTDGSRTPSAALITSRSGIPSFGRAR